MANTKLSGLTAASATADADLFYTAQGGTSKKATALQLKTYCSASPTLVTPVLGVAAGTSLALGGGTTQSAWTTFGALLKINAATVTDSSSSGTVAAQYISAFKAQTVAASSVTTFTNSYNLYVETPVAGTNVTQTNAWALGADNALIGGVTLNVNNVTTVGTVGAGFLSSTANIQAGSTGMISWGSRGIITSPGAGIIQYGTTDVDTAPVAQTLRTQGALAGGTSNIAGANFTIIASPGKGTGAGGSIIFQTAPAGSTGTVVGTPTTALTIDSTQLATFAAGINSVGAHTFTTASKGVVLKQGANGLCGTFVANGVTPVVISNTNVAISDAIIISLNTVGGTVGVQPHVSAITGSTSFAVTCSASDTSTYNYAIIKNAA